MILSKLMAPQRIGPQLLCLATILGVACSAPGSSRDGGPHDAATPDGAVDAFVDPRNAAEVFEINPVATPEVTNVFLAHVADDQLMRVNLYGFFFQEVTDGLGFPHHHRFICDAVSFEVFGDE